MPFNTPENLAWLKMQCGFLGNDNALSHLPKEFHNVTKWRIPPNDAIKQVTQHFVGEQSWGPNECIGKPYTKCLDNLTQLQALASKAGQEHFHLITNEASGDKISYPPALSAHEMVWPENKSDDTDDELPYNIENWPEMMENGSLWDLLNKAMAGFTIHPIDVYHQIVLSTTYETLEPTQLEEALDCAVVKVNFNLIHHTIFDRQTSTTFNSCVACIVDIVICKLNTPPEHTNKHKRGCGPARESPWTLNLETSLPVASSPTDDSSPNVKCTKHIPQQETSPTDTASISSKKDKRAREKQLYNA
ncbi:hypothetical protein BS47DRAFT_1365298 [Hydnum rufescens UP504]|uniref:Uncharacterized protein n=1 Tax=Hydnum rufescens UP504 TaxID=1448309 RepID=A0A9P6DSD4_9AGAM|nr:hypothetical protein BS47DRAFT_1365298 [Hydnum rufescens UP504]